MQSLQAYEFTGTATTLDAADQLWRSLCLEREAAHKEVSECVRATESGSVEAYKRLKKARHRAKTVQHVMLQFLDDLDVAPLSCEPFTAPEVIQQGRHPQVEPLPAH
ncbi:MAG TPA: hypothetical protein VFU71_22295 [Burkholderiaceae bacterium]|nr:hypothetical protein [Burkholderiaceae bacterium]